MPFQPPRLGPGAIYLRSLDSLFWSNADLIRVAEVEPQSLWTKGTRLDSLPRGSPFERRRLSTLPQRLLIHGVGVPIGQRTSEHHACARLRRAPVLRFSHAASANGCAGRTRRGKYHPSDCGRRSTLRI